VPDNADPYGETKPDAVGDWAREAFEYEDEAGFRSKVSSFYVTRWPTSDTRSITVGGKFVTQPEDEYYTQGRHAGAWNFHVTINPEGQSVAEIDGIAVTYDYRGQGVASRWVDRFEREMRRQGVGQVRLFDLSAASSGRGTSFWESLGYEPWDGNMVKDLRT
jgi:GNAT superfamily N-acetyltransferase